MAAVNKQDSNLTNLSYAVEISPGVVDGSVTWFPLEPNSYNSFGGEVVTKARMPINSSRQRKKGAVVDLNASAAFVQDLTASNFQDVSQCFMYAALRKKDELTIASVDGTGNAYQPTAGGDKYYANDLLFAKSFGDSANNGLKQVAAGEPTSIDIPVTDTGLVTASTQTGIISRVGYEYGSGELQVDASGPLPKLTVTTVPATGTLTSDTTNVSDTDTVTIGGKVYTFQTSLTNVDGHVKIGATAALSLTNLFNAINATGGVPGTDYAAATTANPRVKATTNTATTVVVTALASGAVGNSVDTTEASTHLSWGGATLSGGSGGRGLDSFGIIPGEFIFVGDDNTAKQFATAANNGFSRVRSVTAAALTLDKTQHTMVTDTGTGKTIRIYFGRVVKNESNPALIIKRGVQIERTLGAPDDSQPTQIQAEYIVRALANELKVDMKTADIITMEMSFMANTNELRTGVQGIKPGSRPTLLDSDAFNSTSDVAFTKMAIVTAGNASPTPLFAFFTDLTLDVKNNIKLNKAVSVLGAFDSTPGFFEVSGSVTAYFTDVSELQAIKDNDSITLETHLVKFNQGITIDLPLLVMSKATADVKLNEPVMIPLESDAATAKIIDPGLDYTMLWVFWDYLPNLAG